MAIIHSKNLHFYSSILPFIIIFIKMDKSVPKSITKKDNKIYLSIHAKPGSRKEGISSIDDEVIEIAIHAQAQNNKANTALVEFISDALDVPKNLVTFEVGGTSRYKVISVAKDVEPSEIFEKLNESLL